MIFIEIQKLIQDNKLKEAEAALRDCSYEQKQTSTYNKLEKSLQQKLTKFRQKLVKQYISKCKAYLKQGELTECYNLIQDLVRIDSNNNKVIKLKSKIIHKINKQLKSDSQQKYSETKNQVNQLIQNNQLQEALNLIFSIQNLPKPLINELEIQTKRKIIDQKLKLNNYKLNSTPAPQKYDFIKNLFDLENTYPKIQKKLIQTSQELKNYSKKQKKIIIKELLNETKVLIAQKKYLKAKNTATKILKIQTENLAATKLYKKSINLYHTDSFTQAYKILKSKNTI